MANWVIYKHTNNTSGKSYIGLTKCGMNHRWIKHKSEAFNGSDLHFHRAIRKYGIDDWSHELLEVDIPTIEEAKELEIMYISMYDSYSNGYNSTTGGDCPTTSLGPVKHKDVFTWIHADFGIEEATPSGLANKYDLHVGALILVSKGKNKHFKGWQLYIEGEVPVKPFKEEATKLHHVDGRTIVVTISEFVEMFDVPRPQVIKLFNGRSKKCRGWSLTVDNLVGGKDKKVYAYDADGNLLSIFASATACSVCLGLNPKRVSGWLSRRHKSYIYKGLEYTYERRQYD